MTPIDRIKASPLERIKDDLRFWASLTQHRYGTGFPKKVSWYNERVQSSTTQGSYVEKELPPKLQALEAALMEYSRLHISIVVIEYTDHRPQKTKAQILNISRERYNQKLAFMHDELAEKMYGTSNDLCHKIAVA